ncbi:hypothetical protein K402DRAFT_412549 [Aulographum hederae CBS 113979]|uniref:Protein N-terminal and lysine N-methyltransferase EFM7 n=1 Tax=Aulographum hederae CBS 113979 TaxID=1176131 RepID=A0A6G1H1Q3_9PEZI|nr:hypothetical protein K402DRAFT_412549 [Aulographum hederae CBS 113979]
MSSDEEPEHAINLFEDPPDYYLPEKEPTIATHTLLGGQEISLRLVGHNPLWGHLLWNAGRTVSNYIETNAKSLVQGKTVLELGAGAGLPSLVCAITGASRVVVTDYPDADLVENLRYNITHCVHLTDGESVRAEGYLWGNSTDRLVSEKPSQEGFDVLILADLLFNHSEHGKLISSVRKTLKKNDEAVALVFFTPYRPWLLEKDLAFFDLARESGFHVTKVLEKLMEKVMFEEDPGDETLRRTVFGYELKWA